MLDSRGDFVPATPAASVDPTEDTPITTLQAITAVATEILDTSVSTLTAHPSRCGDLIARVQSIGHAWDLHPDWPCRGYYVQLLLTVAGLSRVVEWCVSKCPPRWY
jgi:serine/threonine-protein kinase RIM15